VIVSESTPEEGSNGFDLDLAQFAGDEGFDFDGRDGLILKDLLWSKGSWSIKALALAMVEQGMEELGILANAAD
jgi:hypothetical protein